MTKYKEIFDENIGRVKSVYSLYDKLKNANEKDSKDYRLTDILRAAVVFLHSSFEEYFRNVLIEWLPIRASDDTLEAIPISLYADKKRPDRIYLNHLAKYRNKLIDDVIKESIEEHMRLKSFNSYGEIATWLGKLGINPSSYTKANEINKAVLRRHKIVHEADTNRIDDMGRLTGIKSGDIIPWLEAYIELVGIIETQIEQWENENGQTDS